MAMGQIPRSTERISRFLTFHSSATVAGRLVHSVAARQHSSFAVSFDLSVSSCCVSADEDRLRKWYSGRYHVIPAIDCLLTVMNESA